MNIQLFMLQFGCLLHVTYAFSLSHEYVLEGEFS